MRFALRIGVAWLVVVLCGCAELETDAPETEGLRTGTRYLMAGDDDAGFRQAAVPRPFVFPRDHGSHPDYRIEWWYFTGNLFGTTSGNHYGFELTFFRVGLSPDAPQRPSAWGTNQVWLAHFAVTDTNARRFIADERLARGAMGLAGAQREPFRVWVEAWSAEGAQSEVPPLRLRARADAAAIDLELSALKPPVLQGMEGLDAKGPEPGNASYYYSFTRLDARGSVEVEGRREEVQGLAWMDREWSTSVLSPDVEGWDWFALQLDDGRDIMFYRMRRDDGTSSPYSGGSLVDERGRREPLDVSDVELEIVRHWRSPETGTRYPVAWRMRLPHEDLELEIEPYLDEQEVDLFVRYWEGAVRVRGTSGGALVLGNGYLELAGY